LTIAQNRKKKSDDSDEVKLLKIAREKSYGSLLFTVKGLALKSDKNISDGASIIKEIMNRHGKGFNNMPYNDQTANAQSMISELDQPKNKAILSVNSLTLSYDELKLSHKAFLDGVSKRTITDASIKEVEDTNIAKKKTRESLDYIVNYLNLTASIEKTDALNELINSLSGIIDKANTSIKTRINRSHGNGANDAEKKEDPKKPEA